MKKYLAGGKAMAGSGCSFSGEQKTQYATPALAALIAERDKQINTLWTNPSNTIPSNTNQLVITQVQPAYNKKSDIDTILDGDF